jgi:hypothetical protein
MAASRLDILLEQGGTFSISCFLKNSVGAAWDLTGYSAAAKVRALPTDTSALLTLTATIDSPPTLGSVTITASAASTAALPTSFQLGFWELDVTDGSGVVYPIYKGLARMTPWIAR